MEENLINDIDPALLKLEQQHAAKTAKRVEVAEDEEQYEDANEETTDALERASDALKKNAILFEFFSNPDWCKSITKRDRELMSVQIEKIWDLTEELDKLVEELQDEDDEEDE
jgi:hypothetical protein